VRFLRAAAAGVAAVALLVAHAPLAGADATATGGVADAHITLLEQPGFTPVHTDVLMRVRITGDPNRLNVQATMHSDIGTRSAFDETVQRGNAGQGGRHLPLTRVAKMTGGGGLYTMSVAAPSSTGVYALDVALYDVGNGTRMDGFVTYVVAVPGPGSGSTPMGDPLRLSWIWPFVADPAYRPNGSVDPAVVRELKPDGRLGRLATLLASTEVPVTVAPSPETLEALSALAQNDAALALTLDALRRGTKAALAGPYVPVDIPSLVSAGIHSEIRTQLDAGARALSNVGIQADNHTVISNPLDRGALNQLAETPGAERLVVDPAQLQSVANQLTPARPFLLQADGRPLTAVAIDPGLTELLTRTDAPPALRAQQFIAALAVVQRERPGMLRGVVVSMPSGWGGDAATVDAASIAAQGLRASPFVTVVGLGSLFGSVPLEQRSGTRGPPLVRRVNDTIRSTSAPISARDLREVRKRFDAFRALVARDDPRIRRGEHALLVAMSSVWTGPQGRRRAAQELGVIDASISQYVHLIRGPQQTTITITARRAAIPISFQNGSGQPITVRVRLKSEKLFFPQGSDRVLTLPPHNTTTRFAVETRASGTFPLDVIVSSADGGIPFQTTRFTVRSTVVSGVGLFLTLGAGLFLAGWWANHYRRRRRGQREARASGSVPVVPAAQPSQPTVPASGSVR
jgi:hypothetical protein